MVARAGVQAARLRAMVSAEGCWGWAPLISGLLIGDCCSPTVAVAICSCTAPCVMSEGGTVVSRKGCCTAQPEHAAAAQFCCLWAGQASRQQGLG